MALGLGLAAGLDSSGSSVRSGRGDRSQARDRTRRLVPSAHEQSMVGMMPTLRCCGDAVNGTRLVGCNVDLARVVLTEGRDATEGAATGGTHLVRDVLTLRHLATVHAEAEEGFGSIVGVDVAPSQARHAAATVHVPARD